MLIKTRLNSWKSSMKPALIQMPKAVELEEVMMTTMMMSQEEDKESNALSNKRRN